MLTTLAVLLAVALAALAFLRPSFFRARRLVLPTSALVALTLFAVTLLLSKHLGLAGLAGGAPFLFGTVQTDNDIIRNLIAWSLLDGSGGVLKRIKAKTADYTILTPSTANGAGDPSGTVFTNRGAAGTVVFTLPAPVPALAGVFYEFLGIADFIIRCSTATADTLIALNDIAADTISIQTGGQLIGGHFKVLCDGTSWIGYGDAVGVTFTVAT